MCLGEHILRRYIAHPTSFSTDALFCRNALLDYVEMACKQISKRFVKPPEWWAPPTPEAPPPSLRKPDVKCFENKKTGDSLYCVRCQEDVDEEERVREELRRKEEEEKKDTVGKKLSMRERMKRKAAEARKKSEAAKKQKTAK